MALSQVFQGTLEEFIERKDEFAGMELTVLATEEKEGLELPAPPNSLRDKAHLMELLQAGLNSPTHEVTESRWEQARQEVRRRQAERAAKG